LSGLTKHIQIYLNRSSILEHLLTGEIVSKQYIFPTKTVLDYSSSFNNLK